MSSSFVWSGQEVASLAGQGVLVYSGQDRID